MRTRTRAGTWVCGAAVVLCLLAAIAVPLLAFGAAWQASVARYAASYLQALLICWLAGFRRRPSVWPKIALYGGLGLALGVLVRGVTDPGALAWLPVPPVAAYLFARLGSAAAARVTAPGSRLEFAWQAGGRWMLLQYDRIALARAAAPGVPHGIERALLWRDVEYLQSGQVAEPSGLVSPMLRVVGDGREFVLPVRRAEARAVFDFAVARAETARADPALAERDGADDVAVRRIEAPGLGARNPYLALVVGVLALAALLAALRFGAGVAQPVAAACCGVPAVLAAVWFARLRRANRLLLNHPSGSGASPDPETAPMDGWSALTPAVYPRAARR